MYDMLIQNGREKTRCSNGTAGSFTGKLLLVFIDFLEILICIHFQLAAGSLVAGNDSVGMKLQCTDGPSVVNAALNAVAKSTSLVVTADQKQYLLGITYGANADRKSSLRYLVWIIVKEARVHDQGILGEGAYAGAGYQGGEGLIECNVSVHAASAQEEVDAAVGSNLILVALALCLQIVSHTV